jgi:hypothetical protein
MRLRRHSQIPSKGFLPLTISAVSISERVQLRTGQPQGRCPGRHWGGQASWPVGSPNATIPAHRHGDCSPAESDEPWPSNYPGSSAATTTAGASLADHPGLLSLPIQGKRVTRECQGGKQANQHMCSELRSWGAPGGIRTPVMRIRSADRPVRPRPSSAIPAAQVPGPVRLIRRNPGRRGQWHDQGNDRRGLSDASLRTERRWPRRHLGPPQSLSADLRVGSEPDRTETLTLLETLTLQE